MVIGVPVEEDLVNDGWTDIFRNLGIAAKKSARATELSRREAAMLMEIADFQKMNGVRARVDETVADPDTAEALKPWYRQFCKRPTFNDDYLPTFNRPNVKLIDTSDSQGVERITKTGVVANGVEYRGRLHHLRHRLRGRHGVDAARRLRSHRQGRLSP